MMLARSKTFVVAVALASSCARGASRHRAAEAFVPASATKARHDAFPSANIAFVSRQPRWHTSSSRRSRIRVQMSLPTVEELSTEPFMKQVSYASDLVALLTSDASGDGGGGDNDESSTADVTELLTAQLSHSDGIRGFFVMYLTGDGPTAADADEVPEALREAMEKVDPTELVPLACMNVVMPTAMVTMHTDPDLSASSAQTAKRGRKILSSLAKNPDVKRNCDSIVALVNGNDDGAADQDLMKYWEKFFDNYNYGDEQRRDIADAMSAIC